MDELRAAVLQAVEELDRAVNDYGVRSRAAVRREVAYRAAVEDLELAENFHRAEAHALGLPGPNEAARNAMLKARLDTHREIAPRREAATGATTERDRAAADLREADVCQKAARVKLAALTALLIGGDA